MSAESEHPLLRAGLPEWLAAVPLDITEQTWITVGEDKKVPLKMTFRALETEVGSTIGSMSIKPELASLFAQFTENSSWNNLPKEPTSIKRKGEDVWEVRVGDYKATFTRTELTQRVRESFQNKE